MKPSKCGRLVGVQRPPWRSLHVDCAADIPATASPSMAPTSLAPSAAENVPKDKIYTVPAGTKVLLSLKSGVNTKTARPGDGVYLVSTFPVIVGSHVLIPSGVYVQGVVDKVVPARPRQRARQAAEAFTTMIFPNGQVVGSGTVVTFLAPEAIGQGRRGHHRAGRQQGQGCSQRAEGWDDRSDRRRHRWRGQRKSRRRSGRWGSCRSGRRIDLHPPHPRRRSRHSRRHQPRDGDAAAAGTPSLATRGN